MKVCLLTPEFLPAWGGVGTYTYNLARGLRDRAEVHVLAGVVPPHASEDLDGIHVHPAFSGRPARSGASPFRFQVAVFRRLPRLARDHRLEIVHANHAYMSDMLARLRPTSTESVVTVHTTLDTQVWGTRTAGPRAPHPGLEGRVARWRFFLQAAERRYLRRTPAMIFVSRWVRDRTLQRYGISPRMMTVVHNAIDADRLAPGAPASRAHPSSDGPTLLFAGRLLALKGVDVLLRAMTRLPANVRLVLAGPGAQGPWRALARSLGLTEDRCAFLGPVAYADMPELYRGVDAVVLPSFSESCPMVALEAMACGVPLVAANAGGVSEIVRDRETGWLFPPGDVAALVAQIESVLADPRAARSVASRARAWVEANASLDRMVTETFRFYERILAGAAA